MSIFFGWYIAAVAALFTAYQSAMLAYGFTAFVTPIATTLGWTYTQISLASSIRGLEVGVLDPIAGIIVDRWPARRLMLIGTVIFGLGTICISRATSLAVFYAGFLIVGLGSSFCHNMVPMTVLARWFKKNIGKATGIFYMGFAVGGLFVPLLVKAIDTYGWQDVMLYLSFGALALGVPLSLLFRNSPEEYGLLPDGKSSADSSETEASVSGFSLRGALKTRAFWIIGIVGTFQLMAVHAVTVHAMPHLTSVGMERSTAALGVMIISVIGLGMRVMYGVMADIFGKKYVYALSNGMTTLALVLFGYLYGDSFAMLVLFGVIYGLGVSGAMTVRVPITREYFGVSNFGTVFGMLSVFTVAGGVIGAPLAGWVYDTSATYFPIWFVFAGITMIGTILLLVMPKPVPKKSNNNVII